MKRALQLLIILFLAQGCEKVAEVPLEFDLGEMDLEFEGFQNNGRSVYTLQVPIHNLSEVSLKLIVLDFGDGTQNTYEQFNYQEGSVLVDFNLFFEDVDVYPCNLIFSGSNTAGEKIETGLNFSLERPTGASNSLN